MAEQLNNDEFDKLKLLYKKYGSKLIILISVILITIIVWQYWQKRELENNLQAAKIYQNFALIADNSPNNADAISHQAQKLINLYPNSIFADFIRLEIAKQSVLSDNLDQAIISLTQVAKDSINQNLQAIAKLRLARIELTQHKIDKAITTLKSIDLDGYALSSNMLLGDSYFQKKDYKEAKIYWQKALHTAQRTELASIKNLIQMKINNLGTLST